MLSQRRRHSRWRMFLILSVFLGLICNCELAPVSVSDSSSSSSTSHAKRKSQDIGSLSDFTWQAWLVMDPQAASGMDSATLLRRITPKSVFIAPALLPCPEGYKTDNMNRCVKNAFNLDENAHISFLLQRLNTMYANQDLVGNKGEQKKSTGPLQLNIPLIPNFPPTKTEDEETLSDSIAVHYNRSQPEDREKTKSHATIAYEVKNETTLDEKETTIFLQNSTTPHIGKVEEKPNTVIVTAELVDETNFTETVSYKKPIEPLFDASKLVERLDESDAAKDKVARNVSTMNKAENSTKTSVTLLLSPTKLPSVNDSPLTPNDSAHLFTQTTKKIIIKVLEPTLSTKETTEILSIAEDEQRDNETYANTTPIGWNWKLNESQEILYERNEDAGYLTDSTYEPDEGKSLEVEDGEILKAGEAGMTIPTQNIERLHRKQQNQTMEQKETIDMRDQIVIRFNDSTPTNDKDEVGSNVSSEVSINGDLILETTLLDVSTERLQVTTRSPVTQKIVENNNDNSKESFDRNNPGSSKVVFPQDSHSATFTNLHGHKQDEHVAQTERIEELQAAPSSPKSLLFDPPAASPITEVVEEGRDSKESVLRESPQDSESNVYSASAFRQIAVNLGSAENFVRFPDQPRQPAQQNGYVRFADQPRQSAQQNGYVRFADQPRQPAQQNSYVRFPTNEANSIHSPSYKQHYPANDHGAIYGGGGSSTKSSVPVLQKPVYYLSAPNWKPDRVDRASATAGERQKQSPGLLGFWSNMPLIKDPAMYPFYQTAANKAINDDQSFFQASTAGSSAKTSTADVDRVYTKKQRRTAIVA